MRKLIFPIIISWILLPITAFGQDSLWSRFYGHTGSGGVFDSDRGMCGTLTSDGGYAIGGVSYFFQGMMSEFWLVRTDSNGDTLWTRNYGTSGFEEAHYVIQTDDGGFALCGDTKPSGGNYNLYVVKTDSLGNVEWTRDFGSPTGDDKGYSIIQTFDGGYLATGFKYGASWDVYLVRMDSFGDTLWTKSYGGGHPDVAYGAVQTPDSGFAVAGQYSLDDFGSTQMWLLKTDSDGDTLWTRKYSFGAWPRAEAIVNSDDGGFVIAGQNWLTLYNVVLLLVKTDSLGNEIWHKEYGGPSVENAMSLDKTSDGGYVAGGQTNSYGGGNKDYYIVRTDSNGDSLWTAVFGHSGIDYCFEIRVDPLDDIIAFGQHHIYGSQDFDYWMIKIEDGALQQPVGRCCYNDNQDCADNTETECTALSGEWDEALNCTDDPCLIECEYVLGDVNGSDSYNGLDITYGVAFFKGGSSPLCEPCALCSDWHYCGDVNASCSYNGLDITYGVAYFKGGADPIPCADCPPTQ